MSFAQQHRVFPKMYFWELFLGIKMPKIQHFLAFSFPKFVPKNECFLFLGNFLGDFWETK